MALAGGGEWAYRPAMAQSDDPATPAAATIGGTPRATQRPAGVRAPAHWRQDDAAPPAPRAVAFQPQEVKGRPDPVRYGDWEIKGLAIDF